MSLKKLLTKSLKNMTNKKYNIIYADPPWSYDFGKSSAKFVGDKYPLMKKKDICNLGVNEIAEDNSVLFMWATFPRIDWALEVIKAWGFTYKTCAFTWVKKNKRTDSNFWGMGYYTRSNAEICLLATKGKPLERKSKSVHQIVESPIQKHSKKPDEVRKRIVELFGDISRIELFARKPKDELFNDSWKGWDVWGNEIKNDIEL